MHPNNVPCYAFNVRHASRHLTQFYDHTLAPSGVRVTQLILLNVLKLKGPLSIKALAKSLEMDRTTLGRNLQPLERDGLLEMVHSQEDKRRKDVRLSRFGEEKLAHAMVLWHEAQGRFEERFGKERAQRLLEELRAAAAMVEP